MVKFKSPAIVSFLSYFIWYLAEEKISNVTSFSKIFCSGSGPTSPASSSSSNFIFVPLRGFMQREFRHYGRPDKGDRLGQ